MNVCENVVNRSAGYITTTMVHLMAAIIIAHHHHHMTIMDTITKKNHWLQLQ